MSPEKLLSVRVLTVPSATDRQDRMRRVIEEAQGLQGAEWRFAHAVSPEAAGLRYDEAAAHAVKGRALSAAEQSCFASHVAIMDAWLAEAASEVLLVLEDDVYLDPWFDFMDAARLAAATGLDYLRLYARSSAPARPIAYHRRTQVVRFTWSPSGTQAYMLTRAGARRVLAAVAAEGCIMRPVDNFLDRYWEVGNPVYGLFPPPVLEHNLPSTIHQPEQMREWRERTDALDATRPQGMIGTLQRRRRALEERVVRYKVEREQRHADAAVAARVTAHMQATQFQHLSVSPLAAPARPVKAAPVAAGAP